MENGLFVLAKEAMSLNVVPTAMIVFSNSCLFLSFKEEAFFFPSLIIPSFDE